MRGMDDWKWYSEKLCQFLAQYRWLLDAYVIEFFTEDHWRKLPESWQRSLRGTSTSHLSRLLLSSPFQRLQPATVGKVYPLSLLSFVAAAHSLSLSRRLPRQPSGRETEEREEEEVRGGGTRQISQVTGLDHVFRRHVKPKKQHEIKNLAKEVMKIVEATGCRNILDIGSGQGHLARYLAYQCGLNVVTVDAVGCHLTAAAKFDSEVERDLVKKVKKMNSSVSVEGGGGRIIHVESLIQPDISLEELLSRLNLSDPLTPPTETGLTSFILVGLHTCGNLAPTMLRLYTTGKRLAGLVSVGCCFMKLSCPGETGRCGEERLLEGEREGGERDGSAGSRGGVGLEEERWGYPMSGWVSALPSHLTQLSYEAREVACHSVDSYRDKMSDSSHHVKVHCHRAVVETVLRKRGLRRSQVKISRRISRLPFSEYAAAVLEGLNLPLTDLEGDREELWDMLQQWQEVAAFFMLRLTLAPCVESLLMSDRALFLSEQGFVAEVRAVFDPTLSPRNLLLSSLKSTD